MLGRVFQPLEARLLGVLRIEPRGHGEHRLRHALTGGSVDADERRSGNWRDQDPGLCQSALHQSRIRQCPAQRHRRLPDWPDRLRGLSLDLPGTRDIAGVQLAADRWTAGIDRHQRRDTRGPVRDHHRDDADTADYHGLPVPLAPTCVLHHDCGGGGGHLAATADARWRRQRERVHGDDRHHRLRDRRG